ncbi:MAG: FAD-binding protein [Chloroflexia bacterium]
MPFSRTRGQDRAAQVRWHTREFGKSAVERACYAADRTGYMILQTLYQQSIKDDVTFFNEFHVLDILLENGECAGVVAQSWRPASCTPFRRSPPSSPGRERADVQGHPERARSQATS